MKEIFFVSIVTFIFTILFHFPFYITKADFDQEGWIVKSETEQAVLLCKDHGGITRYHFRAKHLNYVDCFDGKISGVLAAQAPK